MNIDVVEEVKVVDRVGQLLEIDRFRVVLNSGARLEFSDMGLDLLDEKGRNVFHAAMNGSLTIQDKMTAAAKSFSIPHPGLSDIEALSKARLVYGCLEGPEHAVYHRGVGSGKRTTIVLPAYWSKLVDGYTIHISPMSRHQFEVTSQLEDSFKVRGRGFTFQKPIFTYCVIGNRKDVTLD